MIMMVDTIKLKDYIWVTFLAGIGYASVVIVQWLNIYYVVVLAWALYYIFASFTSVLPWSHCNNPWNTDQCVDLNGNGRAENGLSSNSSYNATQLVPVTQRVSASQEFWE